MVKELTGWINEKTPQSIKLDRLTLSTVECSVRQRKDIQNDNWKDSCEISSHIPIRPLTIQDWSKWTQWTKRSGWIKKSKDVEPFEDKVKKKGPKTQFNSDLYFK